jgi:hypothetical protein
MSVAASALAATPKARPQAARIPWTAVGTVAAAAGLLALQVWAIRVAYPLRVTSDVPTYLALLRGLATAPLSWQSPFLASGGIASPHATPYLVGLSALWHAVAPAGQVNDPLAVGRFLGLVGIPVAFTTLAMIVLYAERTGGRGHGVATAGTVLVMFGPAHVVWANDLTFHGFMYAGFYPQNVAIVLALGALLALGGRGRASLLPATLLCGATMVVHPLTGTLLAGLACVDGCWRAATGRPGAYRASFALVFGFLAGTAWPDYPLNQAMSQSAAPGSVIIAACALAPRLAALAGPPLLRVSGARRRARRVAALIASDAAAARLAVAGALIVVALAAWQVVLLRSHNPDPLVHTNRLAEYWGEDRWRWLLMFAAGAVGLPGLVRVARRRTPLPLLWFAGCYGIGVLGLAGLPVPVWWRFLLLGQIPLALGVAVVLRDGRSRRIRWTVLGTLFFSLEFKLLTLLAVPLTITYFGSPLQPAYEIGRFMPARPPGLVASDPFTSYYVPGATGRQVLTETKAHVGSQAELDAATRGYALLHSLYVAPDTNWWPSAQALWTAGVRLVLLEKHTSLAPPDLQTFSTGPTPLLRSAADGRLQGRLNWRLRRVGTLLHDDLQYALYRLDQTRLFPEVVKR